MMSGMTKQNLIHESEYETRNKPLELVCHSLLDSQTLSHQTS